MIQSSTPKGQSIFYVEPEDVFNLSLFEYRFLIDCRSPEAFSQEKILSAFSFPFRSPDNLFLLGNQRLADLFRCIEAVGTPEHISPVNHHNQLTRFYLQLLCFQIVLYGDEDSSGNMLWLSARLQELQAINQNDLKIMMKSIFPE